MESKQNEIKGNNNINIINEVSDENKIDEEKIDIEEIQKKLEEQEENNNNENDLFSHNLENMLDNIARLITAEK
jgi:hypothetical protein